MPSTYTNDLRIEEQATGENSGTWGTKVNSAFSQIAEAFSYGTQDCFSSDADATTTVADGATDPARAMYFKVTSSATLTATRTLTIAPNTISRVMFIENATTGSQSIAISQGSGANVTIGTGKTKVVYLDGAGSGAAVVDAMAKVDPGVNDTLAEILVAGNATGGTDIAVGTGDDITFADSSKAIFGAGSDLQIYHDGSNSYIDDAGSGRLNIRASDLRIEKYTGETIAKFLADGAVELNYNDAKKFETTSTGIDVTGTLVSDGLTVSGVAYIQSTTTPQLELAYNSANITGFYRSGGDFQIKNDNGAGTPETSIVLAEDGAVTLYHDDSAKLSTTSTGIDVTGTVTADGLTVDTDTLVVDATNNRVGIGTSSPAELLVLDKSSGDTFVRFDKSGTFKGLVGISDSAGSGSGSAVAGDVILRSQTRVLLDTGGTTRAVVDASGRVGIGTSSPSYKLSLVDTTQVGTTIQLFRTGSAAGSMFINGGLAFGADGGNGDTQRMVISSSTGNVGIGTSSPAYPLSVQRSGVGVAASFTDGVTDTTHIEIVSGGGGSLWAGGFLTFGAGGGGSNTERMRIKSDGEVEISGIGNTAGARLNIGSDANNAFVRSYSTAAGMLLGTTNAQPLKIITNSVEAARFDANGNFGIGTSSPASILHAVGSTGIILGAASGNTWQTAAIKPIDEGASYKGTLAFYTHPSAGSAGSPTERMRIDSSGNVSVTPSAGLVENAVGVFMLPTGELRVKDNTEDGTSQISIYNNNVTNDTEQFFVAMNLGDVEMGNRRTGYLSFKTNNAERMRIDSSGNLLIGTTAVSGKLTLANGGADGLYVDGTGTGYVYRTSNASGIAGYFVTSSGAAGNISVSGTTTTYNTSSDQRLKDNIVDAPSASDDIDAIQVRSFDWKVDGSHQKYGLVAQELVTVAPSAVSQPEDPEEMMGVDYSKLVPMLIKEVQQLRARVAQLEGAN